MSQDDTPAPPYNTGYGSGANGEFNPETAGPFVPPTDVQYAEDDTPSAHTLSVPQLVMSLTSFNPPRPPESSGQNKKRRLIRWEKQPNTIADDLESYKRTVQKTREELTLAVSERERVEHVAGAIRTHFLAHLRAQSQETDVITAETDKIIKEVRLDGERSNELKTPSQAVKNARARTFVQDTPPPKPPQQFPSPNLTLFAIRFAHRSASRRLKEPRGGEGGRSTPLGTASKQSRSWERNSAPPTRAFSMPRPRR